MSKTILSKLHNKYIRLTPKESSIVKRKLFLGNISLTFSITFLKSQRVSLSTFSLKHLYDKRTAIEYEFIINNLQYIFSEPDSIYKNMTGRIGDLVFHKKLPDGDYVAIIQTGKRKGQPNYLLTSYRIEEVKLSKFQIAWKREAGTPPSSH